MAFVKKTAPTKTAVDVKSFFKPVVDLPPVEGLKVGVFGRAKAGKTHFALTAPGEKYVIDTENAIRLNIQQFPQEVRDKVKVVEVVSHKEDNLREIDYETSLENIMGAVESVLTNVEPVGEDGVRNTIIIDSCTDVWTWLGNWLQEQTDVVRSKSGKMVQMEWQRANKRYHELMLMMDNSKFNFVLTFKAVQLYSSDGSPTGVWDAKWQNGTHHYLNLIGELTYNGVDTMWKFQPHRFGRLSGTLKNPTWDSVSDYVRKNSNIEFL